MDKLDLKRNCKKKGIHMNKEQIYVAFRKKVESDKHYFDFGLSRKHWLILEWHQKNLEVYLHVCMKTI